MFHCPGQQLFHMTCFVMRKGARAWSLDFLTGVHSRGWKGGHFKLAYREVLKIKCAALH